MAVIWTIVHAMRPIIPIDARQSMTYGSRLLYCAVMLTELHPWILYRHVALTRVQTYGNRRIDWVNCQISATNRTLSSITAWFHPSSHQSNRKQARRSTRLCFQRNGSWGARGQHGWRMVNQTVDLLDYALEGTKATLGSPEMLCNGHA